MPKQHCRGTAHDRGDIPKYPKEYPVSKAGGIRQDSQAHREKTFRRKKKTLKTGGVGLNIQKKGKTGGTMHRKNKVYYVQTTKS